MAPRTDHRPAPNERRILERVGQTPTVASPRSELAAAIRRLNAGLAVLPAEPQRELLPDWTASFEELQRQRETAPSEAAELEAIEAWERHWRQVLAIKERNLE